MRHYRKTLLVTLPFMLFACASQTPPQGPVSHAPNSVPIPGTLPEPPGHSSPPPIGIQKPPRVSVKPKTSMLGTSKLQKLPVEEEPSVKEIAPEPVSGEQPNPKPAQPISADIRKAFPWLNACARLVQASNAVQCDANRLLTQGSPKVLVYVRDPKLVGSSPSGPHLREGLPLLYRFYVLP